MQTTLKFTFYGEDFETVKKAILAEAKVYFKSECDHPWFSYGDDGEVFINDPDFNSWATMKVGEKAIVLVTAWSQYIYEIAPNTDNKHNNHVIDVVFHGPRRAVGTQYLLPEWLKTKLCYNNPWPYLKGADVDGTHYTADEYFEHYAEKGWHINLQKWSHVEWQQDEGQEQEQTNS